MNARDNTPTVTLRALVPDLCNYKDQTFKKFVDRFIQRFMPGFPLGLLDTSSEVAHERWEIVEADPHDHVTEVPDGRYLASGDGFEEEFFETEDDAIDFVRERMEEIRYGFPWAQSWAFRPDDRITDDELREAGFTVARYTGGEGGRGDAEYRLCGIDGGGYSFDGAHFAPLCAVFHANRRGYGWKVETDDGEAYITLED